MKNMKWIVLGALITTLTACKQNPFAGMDGEISGKKLKVTEPVPENVIDVEPTYYCEESKPCVIQIRTQVPDPGEPILRLNEYPPGATAKDFVYDAKRKTYTLTWIPNFDFVEPAKTQQTIRDYPLGLRLWSSEHSETIKTGETILRVKNTQQEWTVTPDGDKTVREGAVLTQTVTINSADYPNGPFDLFLQGEPAGTSVQQSLTDPKKFTITYKPDFTFVKISEGAPKGSTGYYRDVVVTYIAKDPGGGLLRSSDATWTIKDVRKDPVFSGPTSLGVRDEAVFSVRSDDLNAEYPPDIRLKNPAPFGRVEFTTKKETPQGTGAYPSTFMDVKWLDIPASKQGTTASLVFTACPKEGEWSGACVDHKVDVQFLFSVAPPPLITRTEWPADEVKYVKSGGPTLRVNLPIEDQEQKSRPVSVEIFPANLRSEVQWMNGQLIINPKTEGQFMVTVEATTVPGQRRSESFILNILPRNWSDIAVFSNDIEKPETQALLALLPKATMVHPLIQKSDPKAFLMRKVFIVTTELLASMTTRSDWAWLDQTMSEIPNLWIATPLVDKLQKNSAYFASLIKGKDLQLPGRLSTFYPRIPLSDFYMELGKYPGIEAPKKLVRVNGKMTSESVDPSLVEVTAGTQKCTNMLTLRASRGLGELAAVCDHKAGGKLVVFGTEFVDFKFEPDDAGLLSRWVTKVLRDGGVQ